MRRVRSGGLRAGFAGGQLGSWTLRRERVEVFEKDRPSDQAVIVARPEDLPDDRAVVGDLTYTPMCAVVVQRVAVGQPVGLAGGRAGSRATSRPVCRCSASTPRRVCTSTALATAWSAAWAAALPLPLPLAA